MNFSMIISLFVMVGLFAIALIPPLLVLRGKRFWAPWLMIASAGFFLLVVGGTVAAQWYLNEALQKLMSSGGPAVYSSVHWHRHFEYVQLVMMVSLGLIVLSFIGYAVGLLGVGYRWQAVAKRAEELEAQTSELAARRESV